MGHILKKYGAEGQSCYIFPSAKAAADLRAYALSPLRKEDVLKEEDLSIRVFETSIRVYVVFYPAPKTPILAMYWANAGVGLCSRLAEDALKDIDLLREVTDDSLPPRTPDSPAYGVIKERIADLLERSPVGPPRKAKVSPNDVFLFPTGMAAIYSLHQYLLGHFNSTSILFGFAFHSTIHVFEDWDGPGFKFFGNGDPSDMEALEAYLEAETAAGRKVQALWAEFPSNPLIITPDMTHLRKLADKYGFLLIADDTICSFCNVDLLSVADVVLTSLTKSFSGYADVMGASVVLNPSSPKYGELTTLFESVYVNDYYYRDAQTMEQNSRDYLSRSHTLNSNAAALTTYLHSRSQEPNSPITKVYYPPLSSSLANYDAYKRAATPSFTPGYGCLFSIELRNEAVFRAFYEELDVHMGPHLGAHLTLAMPYVKALYGKKDLGFVEPFGMRPTQMRISVGLEGRSKLLKVFGRAVLAAEKAGEESAQEGGVEAGAEVAGLV
jgi:cystathionine gamma-synthase